MTTTVTLTKFRSGFDNVPATYAIGDFDDGSSHLVSTKTYELPEGYSLGMDGYGEPAIYKVGCRMPCEIHEHRPTGFATVWSSDGVGKGLKLAAQ